MTWKIPANYPSLESFCTDQRTKLTGNNNANYIHLLIRAIAGHPLETKVFREERSNAKIQVERETAKDVCTIFSRVVFPFIRSEWAGHASSSFRVSTRSEDRVDWRVISDSCSFGNEPVGHRPPLPVFSPLFDRVRFLWPKELL